MKGEDSGEWMGFAIGTSSNLFVSNGSSLPRVGPPTAPFPSSITTASTSPSSSSAPTLPRLQVGQVFLSLLRLPPDPPVEEYHHRNGHVEGRDGRSEGDVMVGLDELNVALLVRYRPLALNVRPRVNPRRPQEEGNAPRAADHQGRPSRRALRSIRQRSGYGELLVNLEGYHDHGVADHSDDAEGAGNDGDEHRALERVVASGRWRPRRRLCILPAADAQAKVARVHSTQPRPPLRPLGGPLLPLLRMVNFNFLDS
ncbi:hypothetical protein J437_LFUL015036 [Ladona fulva]|uniref:Uncharacterized protein n=1 Tax=Ladona fulva TaxID=123851 RepID=A0A8K0KLP5_LADFU|nr:hypothetical protein J437_LFUL015036 [Ladona fulva]